MARRHNPREWDLGESPTVRRPPADGRPGALLRESRGGAPALREAPMTSEPVFEKRAAVGMVYCSGLTFKVSGSRRQAA